MYNFYICIYVCVCIYVYIYIYICIRAYVYICVYICVGMDIKDRSIKRPIEEDGEIRTNKPGLG